MRKFLCLSLAVALLPAAGRLSAQPPARKKRVEYGIGRPEPKSQRKKGDSTTLITMEILTGDDGNGPKAREWSEVLGKMDLTLTVRRGRPGEKPEVTESKAGGSLRTVHVVGMLDSQGRLLLADRVLVPGDNDKVAALLDDLRTYGAQGSPEGQPVWGLTKEQFGIIHGALKRPLVSEARDLELDNALALFELPKECPLKLHPDVARLIKDRKQTVAQTVQGLSQGTALAAILREQGLGFRPRRLPNGNIELAVQSLKESRDVWPVGWPRQAPIPETAPALFQFKTVDLEDEPLDEVLDAIAGQVKMPLLIDLPALRAKGIDFSELKVTYPRKRTTWIEVLKTFTAKAKTELDVRIDEAGKPFVWITPLNTADRSGKEKP